MKSISKNRAPNVENGTHFNLDRFKELYSWINASQMDSITVCHAPFQSGLLYFEEVLTAELLKLVGNELYLESCCATTKNGALIGIFKEDPNSKLKSYNLDKELSEKVDGIYEVLIGVDHVNRTAKGEASTDEVPFRQPFCDPTYMWDVFKKGDKSIKQLYHTLKIGELSKVGGHITLIDFIPPCKHVGAHSTLANKFFLYKKQFNDLLVDLKKIINLAAQENDPDIDNLARLARWLGHFIATEKKVFDQGMYTSVFALFDFCKSFSSVLDFHFHSLTRGTQLLRMIEENVEGFVEETFKEQDFRVELRRLSNLVYNHYDIKSTFDIVDGFLEVIINRCFKLLGNKDKLFPLSSSGQIQSPLHRSNRPKDKGSGIF